MTEVRFVTREIGSLAKPGWRVKSIAGRTVEQKDVEEARKWGERLGIASESHYRPAGELPEGFVVCIGYREAVDRSQKYEPVAPSRQIAELR